MAAFLKTRTIVLPNVWIGTSVEGPAQLHRLNEIRRSAAAVRFVSFEPLLAQIMKPDLRGFDWIIVGGESGPGARTINETWVDNFHTAAKSHGIAFFFKQWGGTIKKTKGRMLHGRTWDEMPVPRLPRSMPEAAE